MSVVKSYQMANDFLTITWQVIYHRNLYHGICTGLLLHGGTCNIDKHLSRKCRIVDTHIKLKMLVVRLATHTLTHQIHAMSHIIDICHARHLIDMCLIVHKIRIGKDSLLHSLEIRTILKFHIYHATMNTCTQRDGYRQSISHSCYGTYGHTVSHTSARTEVCISDSARSKAFHKCAHHTIGTWIPTCADDTYGAMLFGSLVQCLPQVHNLCVDIKTVHCVDAHGKHLQSILLYAACRGGQYSHIHMPKLPDITHHLIIIETGRLVLCSATPYDTSYLHIGSCL